MGGRQGKLIHVEKIARAYGVEDMPAIAAIRKLLRDIASQAANVY